MGLAAAATVAVAGCYWPLSSALSAATVAVVGCYWSLSSPLSAAAAVAVAGCYWPLSAAVSAALSVDILYFTFVYNLYSICIYFV